MATPEKQLGWEMGDSEYIIHFNNSGTQAVPVGSSTKDTILHFGDQGYSIEQPNPVQDLLRRAPEVPFQGVTPPDLLK